MASLNQLTMLGNLTRDPETKYLASGTCVAEFGIAVNERVKKGNDWVDEPCFIDVTLFGKQAEVAGEYLSKGASVLITGRLKYEQWEKEGVKRSKHKFVGDRMQMVGGKRGEHDQTRDESPSEYQQAPAKVEAEADPF